MSAPETFSLDKYIMHHVQNSNEWHLPFLPPIHLPPYITLHGMMVLLWSAMMLWIFCFVYKKNAKVPTGITNALEIVIIFIRDQIALPYLGEKDGLKFTPFLCTLFFFILGLNMLGLIPIFATATGNVSVTASLALIVFCFMVFGCIYRNGIMGFLKAFVPPGVPLPVLFILVPIEFLGVFIKTFALTIRLFANMLAGHIVILAMLGLVIILGKLFVLPAVILATCISLLEVLVIVLQAFIFTLLSAIFIGQMYHPQH